MCQAPGSIEHWNYPSGLSFPSGTAGNPITLQARKGDGVVISAAEKWSGSRAPSSGFWTQSGLSGADVAKNIWRSVSTFSGGAQTMMGFWIEFDHPHQIVRAGSMTNLRAAYSSTDSPTGYAGPSAHQDSDGRVYIRFQRPHPDKYSTDSKWSVNTWDGHPEAVSAGKLVYPISENPNDYVIHLFQGGSGTTRGFGPSTVQYIKIGAGINSLGHKMALSGSHVWCDRGTHLNWFSFMEVPQASSQRTDFFMNRVRCSDGSKLHLSRSEWKFGGWLEGIRSAAIRMFNSNTMNNIYLKDCTIGDYHDMMTGNLGAYRFRWRNCTFVNIFDDGIQSSQNMSQVEIGYCYFLNSGMLGLGQSGSEGDDPTPGQWFLHHNICDNRQERSTNWRAQPHPHFIMGQHSPDGRSPKKWYNNLFIFGPDMEEEYSIWLEPLRRR